MEYFKKEQVFYPKGTWNGKGKDSVTYQNNYYYYSNSCVLYEQEVEDVYQKYLDIKNKSIKIEKDNVIYFFKESKYPRFKFNASCENKKTIQINKADYAIVPIINGLFSINHQTKKLAINRAIRCTLTNNIYHCSSGQLPNDYMNKFNNNRELASEQLLLDKFLIQPNNYEFIDVVCFNNYITGVKEPTEFFKLIVENIDKCITDKHLEEYLNKDNDINLTEEMRIQIEHMLKSTDSKTVDLGVKMLNNFNLEIDGFKISLLIRTYAENIFKGTAYNNVGFKNILKQLNLGTVQSLRYADNMMFLNNVYKTVTDSEQRSIIKYQLNKEIEKRLNSFIENLNNNNKNIPLTITYNVI